MVDMNLIVRRSNPSRVPSSRDKDRSILIAPNHPTIPCPVRSNYVAPLSGRCKLAGAHGRMVDQVRVWAALTSDLGRSCARAIVEPQASYPACDTSTDPALEGSRCRRPDLGPTPAECGTNPGRQRDFAGVEPALLALGDVDPLADQIGGCAPDRARNSKKCSPQ